MKACPGCGRAARPLLAWLLAAPAIVGAVGAAGVAMTRGSAWATPVLVAVGALFAVLVGGTARLGLRAWSGQACVSCGREMPH